MIRLEIIRAMYDYKADREDVDIVPDTCEIIDNWYINGFKTIEELELIFNIEDLYDLDIDLKIYPKDMYEEFVRLPR